MKSLLTSFKSIKAALVLAASLFSVANAVAKITLSCSDSETGACVGSVVELNASNTNSALLQFQYRTSGGDWQNLGSPTRATTTILESMPNSTVYFRVVDKENPANTSHDDNDGLEVKVRTEGCPEACVISDAGDYIHGTDFDLKSGSGTQKPSIPDGIVQAFDQGDSKLYFNKQDINSYHVSNDMAQVFPNGIKPKNYTSNNYYYMYDANTNKGKPFLYTFPYSIWHDKPYTFKMEFYLYFDENCSIDESAGIKLETGQGNFGYQQTDVKVYIDATNELVSSAYTKTESFGRADIFKDGSLLNGAKNNRAYLKQKLLRVEATFYGVFPHTGSSSLGQWNNNADFGMYPLFEQFGGCVSMAIDFISADLPSVCIGNNSVCKDSSITVNAAGFPEDVVSGGKYKWYVYDSNSWREITSQAGKEQASIKIDFIGKRKFKVEAQTNNEYIVDKLITVEFELGGKDCDPTKPDAIEGGAKVCYDKSATAQKSLYSVHSIDTDSRVYYRWTLTNTDDNTTYSIGNGVSNSEAGGLLSNATDDARMPSIYVTYNKAGHYSLKLEVYKQTGTGTQLDKITGTDYTKTISNIVVYDKPTAAFHIVDDANNEIEALCPFSANKLVVADIANAANYNYVWSGATGSTTDPGYASVDISGDPCTAKGKSYDVKLTVSQKEMESCATELTQSLTTNFAKPAMNCDNLHTKVGVDEFNTIEYAASAKSYEYTITLPKPVLSGESCNPDPNVNISITGNDVEGNAVNKTITKKLSEMTETNTTVTLPVSVGKTGTNGYNVSYTVSNGCGGTDDVSDACEYKVIVRYGFDPDVDCSTLKPKMITGYLSAYDGACKATPGSGTATITGHNPLPLISTQTITLVDKNTTTTLTGKAIKRTPVSEDAGVDDPYSAGDYTITWQFTNKAGNSSTCDQTVRVIDDTKPNVKCTSTGGVIEITTDDGLCYTTSSSAYTKIVAQLVGGVAPTASPTCSGAMTSLSGIKYYKVEGSDVLNEWTNDVQFEKGKTYTIIWRFTKKALKTEYEDYISTDVYADCSQDFKIVDKEDPVIDCGGASSFVVTVNYKKNKNSTYVYKYASGKEETTDTKYTAQSIIEAIPSITTDNCNDVSLTVSVDSANATAHPIATFSGSNAEIIAAMRSFEFYQKTSSVITYTFTDGSGNVTTCEKTVYVTDRSVPNPTCWAPEEQTLEADDNCEASYDGISLNNVLANHMASFTFTRTTTKYKWSTTYQGLFPVSSYQMEGSPSSEQKTYTDEVAPSSIIRQHYVKDTEGNWVEDGEPIVGTPTKGLHSEGGSYKICKIQIDQYRGNTMYGDHSDGSYRDVNTVYRLLPTQKLADGDKYTLNNEAAVLNTKFPLGKTVITFNYTNGDLYELDQTTGKYKITPGDSTPCTVTIIVEDKTKPVIDCEGFEITKTYQLADADADCMFDFADTDLKVPTLDDLRVSPTAKLDNCTDITDDNFSILVNDVKVASAPSSFPIGTTNLKWVVTDEAGNSSYCENKITVIDKTAPDCSVLELDKNTITVAADENCQASPATVFPHGFNPPVIDNDKCSPVTDAELLDSDGKIKGVGTRDDGFGVFDDYYKSETVISWTFTDAAGNSSTCEQKVIVKDETGPDLTCEPKDLKYTLTDTECEAPYAKVSLKQPGIKDNCSTTFDVSYTRQYIYHSGNKGSVLTEAKDLEADYKIGTTVIYWTVKDEAGNDAHCTQNIIVTDNSNFDFECPKPIEENAALNACSKTVEIDPSSAAYVRHDKCDNSDIIPEFVKRSDGKTLSDVFPVGVTTIYWTYRDSSGNTKDCEQTVTIHDVTPPEVSCIAPPVLHEDSTGSGSCVLATSTLVAHLKDKSLIPTATDACQEEDPVMTGERYYYGLDSKGTEVLQKDEDGNVIEWNETTVPYQPGYYRIHFIFTDKEGNSAACDQEVYIKDSNKPDIDCSEFAPSKIVNPKSGSCDYEIKLADLGATGNATEHCSPLTAIEGTPYIYDGEVFSGSVDDLTPFVATTKNSGEKLMVVWKFTSHHNVNAFCPQIITVEDNQAPTCTPDAISVLTTDDAEDCNAEVVVNLSTLHATDNCGDDGIKYEYSFDGADYEIATGDFKIQNVKVGSHTIDWRLTDKYGVTVATNAVSCTSTIVVKDNTKPKCDDLLMTDVPTADDATDCNAQVTLALPTGVSDNCADVSDITYAYKLDDDEDFTSVSMAKKLSLAKGKHVITWRLYDGSVYNESACKTTVTVVDNTKPKCSDKDLGNVKSEETACNTDVEIKLSDITATDNCSDSKITYKYKLDDEENYHAIVDDESFNLAVGAHTITWQISDGTNVRNDACKTTVTVLDNRPLVLNCDDIEEKTFKTDDCGPVDISSIDIPEAIDPCATEKIKGTPDIDLTKALTLGDHEIVWSFVNMDGLQPKTCTQTIHVVTTQELITDCKSPTDPIALKDGECLATYPLTQRTATNPCDATEVIKGDAYAFGALVDPSKYATMQFPAGSWTVTWKFKSTSNTLAEPETECTETIVVNDENGATLPCKDGYKVEKTIDACEIDAAKLDFGNTSVIADEICQDGKTVTPSIWIDTEEGVDPVKVDDPTKLGTFKPGTYNITWEYIFHPSGLGELKAYCHQPIEIKTDKKIVTNCDANNFKDINVYADATCQVPASEVKFEPANATNPCDASVVLKPQAYLGTEKVTDNIFTAPFPKGTTVVTWKYTDPTGTLTVSEAECPQNVVVTDTTKPEVTCEADKDYFPGRDADGKQSECEAAAGVIDLQRPTVSDNCSSDASDFKFWLKRELNGEVVDSAAAFKVGTTNVTWTVMDKDGNTQTCTMKVVVNDTVTPKLDCPADMLDLQAKEGECGVIIDDIVPTGIKDACDAKLIVPVGTRDDGLALTDSFPTGKTTVITWVYTDSIGNQTTCKQNIFVKDVTKPDVDCSNTANPINVETELGQCEVPSSVVVDKIKLPTAKDKCQTEDPVMTSNRWYLGRAGDSIPTRQLVGGEDIAWNDDVPFKAGYYQIHFIFTDLAGNADSCSQVVFVKDSNPPYLNNCEEITDQTLNPATGECDAPIVPLDLNSYKGHEVCTGVEIEGVPSLLLKEGDDFVVSADAIPATVSSGDSIYIRWTYTSQMGVSAYCDQKIKVVDNQKPTIDCDILTPDINLVADADKCEISAANADIKYPTVEDNCGTITGRPVRIDTLTGEPNGLTMDDPYPTGKSVIRWYFEDTNDENTQSCDQVVYVKGSVNPEIDCDTIEGKVLVDTINTCDITEQTLKVVAPVAIDKCAPTDALKSVTGVGTRSDGKAIDDLYPLGITTITWTFTDFTGNASTTCTQKVNIVTRQKMIMDCADTVATYDLEEDECLKAITLDQRTAKHPCPDAVDADKQVIKGVAYLNGSLEALTSLDIKLPQGSHVITWVFTDDTHTLANPVDTCYDSIKVGNNNVPPVPCVNENIDTTLQDVCEISAAEIKLKNTGVDAPQLCGDEGEMVTPSIWRTSNPTKVVNTPADLDAFTTGKDTVIWKYDFNPGHLTTYTVYCKQAIDVKTTKEIELACPDSAANTIEIVAPAGLCEVPADTITLNPLVGKNPCIDTVFIHGVPDRDTTLAWPLGVTTITWTYTDTTNTLTNPTATCKQYVSVKDTVNPEIDCETLYNDVKLTTKVCELSADDLGLKGQPVTQCEFVMDPVPTRFSGKDFNDPYVIGNDTVYWTYTYEHNGKSTVCPQAIILRDTAPVFDCEKLKDTTLTADDEECVINKSLAEVLDALDPYPTAVDPCDASYTIKGTYKLADVDTLPTQLTAGDTLHVVWSFADTTRSADTTTCDQLVIIKGNATPEINCDEATPALKDTIDDCGPDHELLVSVPKAFDKCFGDSIPGSFVRSDKAANLNDPFALGDTYITWTFWNIDSTKSTTCEQNIHIYTNSEIIKPCDTAALATIVVAAPEDACTVDASDVDIPRQYALNPCNGDTIWGVMSRPNASAIDAPYNIGKNLLVWTFTDTTNTLVKSVDTCRQYVNVGSVEVEPVSCDSFPNIEKVLAEGNCSIDAASLGIKAPSIIDRCPNGSAEGGPVEVLPVITRYTKPGWTSSQASELEEFTVGVDTIWWSYPRFETVCAQAIHIWDSVAPKFDCDNLQPIVAVAPDGTCELNVDSVLVKPYPVAHEACTDSAIVGVPTLLNGDPLPETLKVGDSIVVLWTFELPELSTKAKTCEQPIRAMGTAAPQFDCESLKLLEFVTDGCDINLDQDSIETPVATDSCTGKDVPGVGVRADGGDLYGTYPLGKTTITWTFTSPDSKVSKSCEQVVEVKTKQEIDAKCGEENYPSLSYEVKDGKCTVPADSVSLTAHEAYNPCNTDIKITGVATRSDSLAITDAFPIGVTTITWTFTDTTNTLVNPTSSCTQTVTVVDHNIPDPDCETSFPAVRLVLDDEDCDLDFSKIPVYINQIPTNPCSGELAMIDTSRTSGKGVHDPYTVGSDTLVWKFWFPTNNIEVFCYQKVTVADTIAPAFDCNTLADTIEVEIMTEGNTVTFEEVKAKGFYIPEVTDKCTEVFTEVTRSDNKELEDDYMLGNTDVTFRFSDAYGNDTICMQTIKVVDMIPPKVICPPLENTLSCADDTTPAYKTFEEFKAAGGSVDPESKADLFSFRHEDTREGDDCKAVITREYFLTSINNVNVHCESAQHFYVRDSIAPVYVGIPTGGYSIVSSCDNPNDEPLEVTATDNCDPEPVVSYERVSTQGGDPSQCDYYTYDVTYTYKAVDRCGNAAEPVVYTIHVKDTVAPSIRKPEHWDDVMYPVYLKHCEFGTPDITAMIPSDSIDQNCGDNQYLTIWQEPAAGTKIETTTVVNLHIVDVCGNDMVMHKTVAIQPREEIIDITILHKPYLACGSDDGWLNPRSAANSLTSSDIKRVYGKVKVEDWDGTWGDEITNAVVDYYRDTVDFDHLVYSSPGATYSDLFKNTEPKTEAGNLAFGNCVLLTRRSQSDTYFFVATDTVTGCTDTASVYIDVRERPRIALESGQWNICEGDSLTLKGEFGEAFAPCVDEMGSSISAEGWMVNDSVYHPLDSVNYDKGIDHMAVYYATNECGTTTSLNSLYTSCAGDLETHADSLAYAGSESRLEEMKDDSLYVSDSVKVNVYTHYDPTQVLLTTDPQDKARIWIGDEADLMVSMPYEEPSVYKWMQVVGDYDAEQGAEFDKYGNVIANGSGENDDEELQYIWDADDSVHYTVQNTMTVMPVDTSYYYVVVGNGVCPTVSSNLVSIDLLDKLPTAITPYTKDGMNDDFVRGHHVIIFNRYGQQVFEGNDGWDGTYRGLLADPGVYFYTVDMAGGVVLKGSVEVVKIK